MSDRTRTRINLAVLAGTGTVVALLFTYPASRGQAPDHGAARGTAPGVHAGPAAHDGHTSTGTAAGVTVHDHTGSLEDLDVLVPLPPPPGPDVTVVDGTVSDTQFGPVQVQVRLRGRTIVEAYAMRFPADILASKAINEYAVPLLQDATIALQSAEIDTVSGATDTSEGYRASLQAALDAAHLTPPGASSSQTGTAADLDAHS